MWYGIKNQKSNLLNQATKIVFAEFKVNQQPVDDFKKQLETEEKLQPVFEVDITDTDGTLIAKVWKTLYIARK